MEQDEPVATHGSWPLLGQIGGQLQALDDLLEALAQRIEDQRRRVHVPGKDKAEEFLEQLRNEVAAEEAKAPAEDLMVQLTDEVQGQ